MTSSFESRGTREQGSFCTACEIVTKGVCSVSISAFFLSSFAENFVKTSGVIYGGIELGICPF